MTGTDERTRPSPPLTHRRLPNGKTQGVSNEELADALRASDGGLHSRSHQCSAKDREHGSPSLPSMPRPSLRLDIELLRQRTPVLLQLADGLRSAVGRARAVSIKTERNQSLLDLRTLQILCDVLVQARDDLRRHARGPDHGEKSV